MKITILNDLNMCNSCDSPWNNIDVHHYSISDAISFFDRFRNNCKYQVINLDKNICNNILKIANIGIHTNKIPESLIDEFNEVVHYLENNKIVSNNGIFVRLNSYSPKDGKYGTNLLMNWYNVVEQLCTSKRVFYDMKRDNCLLYCFEYNNDWKNGIEFRVYIVDNEIRAISQYDFYHQIDNNYNWNDVCDKIQNFCHDIIQHDQNHDNIIKGTLVIDVVIYDDIIELIEFNSLQRCGSCLFDWKKDINIFLGNEEPEFRICVVNSQ